MRIYVRIYEKNNYNLTRIGKIDVSISVGFNNRKRGVKLLCYLILLLLFPASALYIVPKSISM